MIDEMDASIRSFLRDSVVNGEVEVAFDAPSSEWAAKRTAPTLNVFLFDIREDIARRRVEAEPVTNDDGVVVGRRRPPRRFKLSYLVTAWTQRPEDEHRLLSGVIKAFLSHEEFPREQLEGSLAEEALPIFASVGIPPPPERSIGEIWSAMGGELKPSVELVLSVPFALDELRHAGPPVEESPRIQIDARDGPSESVKGKRPSKADTADEPDSDQIEETFTGGGEDSPGRRFTVSTIPRKR